MIVQPYHPAQKGSAKTIIFDHFGYRNTRLIVDAYNLAIRNEFCLA